MRRATGLFLLIGLCACGDSETLSRDGEPVEGSSARLLALSTYSAPVGTVLDVHGLGFPRTDDGRLLLHFDGQFVDVNGGREPVQFATPARRVDASTLRWTGFGPYKNPFSASGVQVGRFVGNVSVRPGSGGDQALTAPMAVEFEVEPSILVHQLQPLTASCRGGAVRVLGGAAYRLEVEAVGFEPVTFTYTVAAPGVGVGANAIRHIATGQRDQVGDDGSFRFPEVPENLPSYSALLTIEARDSTQKVRRSAFAISVHRPIEVFYNGNVEVAEIMPPQPVSACIPGGVNGRNVSYSESQAETRSRSFAMTWNESWLRSHTVSAGSSATVGLTETNGVGFSTTDGQTFNWSLGSEVNGSFGLDKLISVGVKMNSSVGGATNSSATNSQNRSQGINEARTTTETETVGQSTGGGRAEALSWSVSSTEVISTSFGGRVIAGTYGAFYRQALRLVRRAALVAYNQCGFAEVVGEVDFIDWTWAPDLALAETCPPMPASSLPAAACFAPPCQGD